MANKTITAAGDLTISVDSREVGSLVGLRGRLNIDTSPALRECLLGFLRSEPPEAVIVDLTEASYIDLSGIATLIEALKIARNHRTTLHLQGLHGPFLHLLELAGLLPLFKGSDRASGESVSKVI